MMRSLALISLSFFLSISQTMARGGMFVEFQEGFRFHITQLCTEKGHVRPIHPTREVCELRDENNIRLPLVLCPVEERNPLVLKRPIFQISHFDLGEERFLTQVERFQTQNVEMRNFLFSVTPNQERYSIPNCPNSMIDEAPHTMREMSPSDQELVVFTGLFQHGITLIRAKQGGQDHVGPQTTTIDHTKRTMSFTYSFETPQCQAGQIDFTEEFIQYLYTPNAFDYFFRSLGGEGSGSGRYHPGLNIRLIGGEGSGSGRIVYGGEGSGSGRAIEGRRIDPMSIDNTQSGLVQVTLTFHNIEQVEHFGLLKQELMSQLANEIRQGEQLPASQLNVQCK